VGGDAITIQTAAPEQVAAGINDRFGQQAAVLEGNVRLELPDGHQWIARLVEAFPGQIEAIRLGKPTLQDVFIKRTGRRPSEDAIDEEAASGKRKTKRAQH